MSNPIYKDLPDVERKKNGSLYQMTSSQPRLARALIRRECCSYEDGSCMELDDGESIVRAVPSEFTDGRKHRANRKGGQEWTIRGWKAL